MRDHSALTKAGFTLFSLFGIFWVISALMGVVITGLVIYLLFQAAIYLDHLNQIPH